MNIALVGYGKMGKMIETIATTRGHSVVARIDPVAADADAVAVSKEALAGASVALEFSHPSKAVENIEALAAAGTHTVVGTTGWYDRLSEVEALVAKAGIGLVWGSNYSLGVNIFYRVVAEAARIMNGFPEYDVGCFEAHHNKKADSPSGTARSIAKIILDRIDRKTELYTDRMDRKAAASELHVASLRIGSVPGTHTVLFDSAYDTIELTHTARGREGLALGAVLAAEWVADKRGLFTVDDCYQALIGGKRT